MKAKNLYINWLPLLCLLWLVVSCATELETTKTLPAPAEESFDWGSSMTNSELSSGDSRTRSLDNMVELYVSAAEFEMGSQPDEVDFALKLCKEHDTNCNLRYFFIEQPVHKVQLDGYWIDQTEVSNRQYNLCVQAGVCQENGCPEKSLQPGHPAVCVTWQQAKDYCQWVGGRLPTEAEWEHAARGPEARRYPWGDEFDGIRLNYCDSRCELAKADELFDDGFVETAPVGSYPSGASWIGALDMAGNVWEWTADFYGRYQSERQVNPLGPPEGGRRVLRGGSWHTSPDHVRSALRTYSGPNQVIDHAGFRCANNHD